MTRLTHVYYNRYFTASLLPEFDNASHVHLIYLSGVSEVKVHGIREHCVIHIYVQPPGPFDAYILYP